MKPFCEAVITHILPTVRALIAKELIINYNMTQEEVAKKLGTTQSAISQYIRGLRGRNPKVNKKVYEFVKDVSQKIANDEISSEDLRNEICNLCKVLR
jgi:hypothetical protein